MNRTKLLSGVCAVAGMIMLAGGSAKAAQPGAVVIVALNDISATVNTQALFLDPTSKCKLAGVVKEGVKPGTFQIEIFTKVCGSIEYKISALAVPRGPVQLSAGLYGPVFLREGDSASLIEKKAVP